MAIHFLVAGLTVSVETVEHALTSFEGHRFREQSDVTVSLRHIIEVKTSTRDFHGRDDWPFPWGAYTCTVKRWHERERKPLAFVVVSQVSRVPIVIPSYTFPEWFVRPSRDSRRGGHLTDTYCAPKHAIFPFKPLVDALVQEEARERPR